MCEVYAVWLATPLLAWISALANVRKSLWHCSTSTFLHCTITPEILCSPIFEGHENLMLSVCDVIHCLLTPVLGPKSTEQKWIWYTSFCAQNVPLLVPYSWLLFCSALQ